MHTKHEFQIVVDDLQGAEVAQLLLLHQNEMRTGCPPESVHALDLKALQATEVTFWSAWYSNELAGCGALKQLLPQSGEIKSMRTATAHLRKGVASCILDTIIAEAHRRQYRQLLLETGTQTMFAAARKLYRHYGFVECEPFADYRHDPNSTYMQKRLYRDEPTDSNQTIFRQDT